MFRPVHDSRKKAKFKSDQEYTDFQNQTKETDKLAAQMNASANDHETFMRANGSGPKLVAPARAGKPEKWALEDDDPSAPPEHNDEVNGRMNETEGILDQVSAFMGSVNIKQRKLHEYLKREQEQGLIDNAYALVSFYLLSMRPVRTSPTDTQPGEQQSRFRLQGQPKAPEAGRRQVRP